MKMKIGELAKQTGCEIVTIRYHEKEGLLPKPARSGGNFRLYSAPHTERLQFIRHCRSLDMTLGEIRTLLDLRDNPNQNCGEVNALVDGHIQQVQARVEALLQLKKHLVILRESCSGTEKADVCGILEGLKNGACHPITTPASSLN